MSALSRLKVVRFFTREHKNVKKTFCARLSLMSHKIGSTWTIDAKNALLNAESIVLYVCKLSGSYLLPIQIGRSQNSARFFFGGGGTQYILGISCIVYILYNVYPVYPGHFALPLGNINVSLPAARGLHPKHLCVPQNMLQPQTLTDDNHVPEIVVSVE